MKLRQAEQTRVIPNQDTRCCQPRLQQIPATYSVLLPLLLLPALLPLHNDLLELSRCVLPAFKTFRVKIISIKVNLTARQHH